MLNINKQIKEYTSDFFKKHTSLGFIAFLLSLSGFGITFVYFMTGYFFPKEIFILELIYFLFWSNFFLATYLILFSSYQRDKKKLFSLLALFLVFIPLVFYNFYNFFDYVEIITFWGESITIVATLMLISSLFMKFKNHFFMKFIYAFIGTLFIYFGFKFEVFQSIYHGIITFGTGITLFFLFVLNLFFGNPPTPSQHFEEFFGQSVPIEVKKISFEDESLYMLWGYGLYRLNFKAKKNFLDDLALQTKFPEENSKNKAIHKIECPEHTLILSGETCYKGVIYPYVHTILKTTEK